MERAGRPPWGWPTPGCTGVVRLMGPWVLTLGVVRLNFLVMTNLASRLGEGSVSALNYAWLGMQLPQSILGTAIAIALFPTLAELAARDERDSLRSTLSAALRAILALTIPAAVGLILLGRPLIQLLFQGGAFQAGSTQAVCWALEFYALGLVGHSALEVVARIFYAQQDTKTPLAVAAGAMLAHLVLSLGLTGVLGHGALALANSVAVTLEVAGLLWIAHKRLAGIEGGRILASALRCTLAAVVTGGAVIALRTSGRGVSPLALGLGGGLLRAWTTWGRLWPWAAKRSKRWWGLCGDG